MSARSLFEPVLDGGIANPNWFEGRLLTAEAMRAKDEAERARLRLLGRAAGAGVIEGLVVTAGDADGDGVVKTLRITSGAALAGSGDILHLHRDVTVDVVPAPAAPAPANSLFKVCDPGSPAAGPPLGDGIYVLLVGPASGYRDRAPKSGLGSEGVVTGCGDAFVVDGVRFRTEKLEPQSISGTDDAERRELAELLPGAADPRLRSLLRNLIAHLCLGTRQRAAVAADPFARAGGVSTFSTHGAIDDLAALGRISACEVPLGLLLWDQAGVRFVDNWAVRRRPAAATPSPEWPEMDGPRAGAEAEARLLQFQGQLVDLEAEVVSLAALRADDYFRYLPPAAFLPIETPSRTPERAVATFLPAHPVRGPIFIEGARVPAIVRAASLYPPIALAEKVLVNAYVVRENRQPPSQGDAPTPFILITSGHLPFLGEARFDVNRWSYANYTSALAR